jgi:hypothetical protein
VGTSEIKVGDWICFWNGDEMVISCVRYILKQSYYPLQTKFMTDLGSCYEDNILEVRRGGNNEEAV